jgi:hypothetical protein
MASNWVESVMSFLFSRGEDRRRRRRRRQQLFVVGFGEACSY